MPGIPAASGRRWRRLGVVLVASCFTAVSVDGLAGTAAAKQPVIPSQAQVDAARAAAHDKAVQIGQTQAELAAADAALQKLNDQVETLVEAYNGATVKLQSAQAAADQAQADLVAAKAARDDAQLQMDQFAAQAYMGSGDLGRLTALMTAPDPEAFMARAGTLAAIGRHRQGVIDMMTSAEARQAAAQHAAEQALAAQQQAAEAAAKAKDAAVQAMNDQAAQVAQITRSKQDLQAQLAVLQGKASSLAKAREDGLKRLAAERAAAAV